MDCQHAAEIEKLEKHVHWLQLRLMESDNALRQHLEGSCCFCKRKAHLGGTTKIAGRQVCMKCQAQIREDLDVHGDSTAPQLVYWAKRRNLIKIGISRVPASRMKALGAELLHVEPGGRELETLLHSRYAHLQRNPPPEFSNRTEWFAMDKLLRYDLGARMIRRGMELDQPVPIAA